MNLMVGDFVYESEEEFNSNEKENTEKQQKLREALDNHTALCKRMEELEDKAYDVFEQYYNLRKKIRKARAQRKLVLSGQYKFEDDADESNTNKPDTDKLDTDKPGIDMSVTSMPNVAMPYSPCGSDNHQLYPSAFVQTTYGIDTTVTNPKNKTVPKPMDLTAAWIHQRDLLYNEWGIEEFDTSSDED